MFTKIYKLTMSPILKVFFAGGCRHYPTCSEYTKDAFHKYGFVKGGLKSAARIIGCNPLSNKSYYDPA